MKKLLLVLLVIGGAVIGGSYYLTGRLPWVATSPEEQQVAELREEFSQVRQQWKQAGKAATFGMDTTSMVDPPLAKLEKLEGNLTDLMPKLKTTEARLQAEQLRREIVTFKSDMR